MQVVVVYTVHLVKLFLISELIWLFLRHVAHSNDSEGYCWCGPDRCTDDDIPYDEEQKHESGEVVVVPAIGQSTPAEQQFRQRGHQ